MTTSINHRRPARRLLSGLLAALGLLLLAMPASSLAGKASFGADLSAATNPLFVEFGCSSAPGAPCTRVPTVYSDPPHAGNTPFAPEDGVITRIKLLASNPGKLRIQLAKRGQGNETKITRNGPKIKYKGTGSIETFKVHVPVKHFEWLAFKARVAHTLSCPSGGFGQELQYQPALQPGGVFSPATAEVSCTHLIEARMKF